MKLKISRLFHWLYATLMFLPLLMFIPSCLYYGFNEHAINETTTEINYKYQSNEVNTLDDLVEGNIYSLDEWSTYFDSFTSIYDLQVLSLTSYGGVNITYLDLDEQYVDEYFSNSGNSLFFTFDNTDLYISFTNENAYAILHYEFEDITFQNLVFVFNGDTQPFEADGVLPQYTDFNVIESVDTNVQDTISNKMYQAWEGVWNLPLFQWTKNSFITVPFSYITGLFGLSSDNSLNCVFTYFASISICWLVFDLIMYVPNLAHRWLDRSAIE